MEKNIYIKDIQDGQQVEGLFLLRELKRAETRAGNPYLMLTVMDKSGEMAARIWEDVDQYMETCRAGQVVSLTAQAQAYKNVVQLKINSMQPATEDETDLALFLPITPFDIEQMVDEMLAYVNSMDNPHLQGLLLSFFQSAAFLTAFKKAPAAKLMHHAYLGGLLEHTLGVTRLANMVCNLYPVLDRSMLLAGAILHDVGKVAEFSFDVFPFDYSDRGRLVGHMVLGIEMIQNRIHTLEDFPEEVATQLNHLILSHHGRYEYGSPVLPMTREAFVLNFIDELDSKMNFFNKLGEQMKEAGHQWTDYQKTLERFLYLKSGSPEQFEPPDNNMHNAPEVAPSSAPFEVDPRQTSLWKR